MKSLCLFVSLLAVVYGVKSLDKECTKTLQCQYIPTDSVYRVHGFLFNIGKDCTNNSQCQPGECCQILSESPVVSKRIVATNGILPIERIGVCAPYKLEGDSCGIFDKTNGFCSCEPGTSCNSFEVKFTTQVNSRLSRRRLIAPRPGYYWIRKCTKSQ